MTRTFFAGTSLLATLLALGCSGPTAPALPSNAQPAQSIPVGIGANAESTVVPWSCVVQNASFRGIFAGAILETACPVRLGIQSRLFATAAPTAPPNLTSSVSGSTVTLTWLVPTSPDPATSYVIEAGSSAGATNIAVIDTLSTSTSFTATGVPAGTYFVRVRARNSAGTSAASNEVVVIVGGGACTTAPGAPSGLSASVNGSSVTLTWTAPSGGCPPTGYVIEAGSSSGANNLANFNTGSTATTFSASGVPNGTYFVRVRAGASTGVSGASNEVIVTVGTAPASNLSGTWAGSGIVVVFQHSGSTLTGTFSGFPASFNLQQTAASGTTLTFSGSLTISFPGPCSPAVMPGSLVANTADNSMTGSFSGRNTDCRNETDVFNLRKQ